MNKSTNVLLFFISAILLLTMTCVLVTEAIEDETRQDDETADQSEESIETGEENIIRPSNAVGLTYYIRPDGGSYALCTGTTDAAYSGSGDNQECAWNHPFQALPPEGPVRIKGGETLVIAEGSYMMGYSAPGAESCDSDYPWDCFMPPVPSGAPGSPTRILGAGWDSGCTSPPELWGTERAYYILNLDGASNVEVACLEITDHAACTDDHTGGLACKRDIYPFGEWAESGLYAADSTNIILRDLNIHGLSNRGIHAGRLSDWTVERVRLAANGYAGWDGDIDDNDANSGTLEFHEFVVEWNGCVETYPDLEPIGCWAQSAGGYGDGLGTGQTGGAWIFEDSAFLHNTSDGLDLLYTRQEGSSVVIKRTIAEGNAGNQIKTTGPAHLENVIAVSNCGFFQDQPFTHNVDYCRAGGSALALYPRHGNQLNVINSTITGNGDCLVISECGEGGDCDGTESILLRNSILLGNPEFLGEGDTTCLAWSNFSHELFVYDHDIISDLKAMPGSCPPNSLCNIAPGLVSDDIDSFNANLLSNSPAIDLGSTDLAPPDDFSGTSRDNHPDIGAYEYWEPSALLYLPFTKSS